jgi:hypothetical protein
MSIANTILRVIVALFVAIALYLTATACAAPTVVTEYKIVEVPVVCDVEMPLKPQQREGEIVLRIVDLLEYVTLLENAFRACKGVVND